MPLQKQGLNINFAGGLDTKTDKFQVSVGKFLTLDNSIFDTIGRLTKRNGFNKLSVLPDTSSTFLTTFNGNLTAIGTSLQAYSAGSNTWINKGALNPINLSITELIRNNNNQTQVDAVVASNGLVCTVYTDVGSSTTYKYSISDSVTGQNIIAPTPIPVTSGTVTGSPRVFLLATHFIIVFTNVITATDHLQYIAISISNPTIKTVNADISASYIANSQVAFDGVVANNNLYIAWNGSDLGGAIRITYIDSTLALHSTVVIAGELATMVSVTADMTPLTPIIYVTYYDSGSEMASILAVDSSLNSVLAPTPIIMSEVLISLTAAAQNGIAQVFYEIDNSYPTITGRTDYISTVTCTQAGVVGTPEVMLRSVGLASKAFILDSKIYMLSIFSGSTYQPTYFLIDSDGNVVAKLAYSNSPFSYYSVGLPNISINESSVSIPYLIQDLLQAVNKLTDAPTVAGTYTQTGISLASFNFNATKLTTNEIGKDLYVSGGYLTLYDGLQPTEYLFHVWPDTIKPSIDGSGVITAGTYFYVAIYEWSDNQGNIYRSAPSVPVSIVVTGSQKVSIAVPTLRLTSKINNPVKIQIYRSSVAQQTYYQLIPIANPLYNDPTVDEVTYVDNAADVAIIGNTILYTTGGLLENIAPPATDVMTLFQSRLWILDSEDKNLLWFSKQVIEGTPVEMSDLLTYFVSPTTGSQGSTGPITALSVLDDKLIIFKENAIYYINGAGPDNTGANSQFSEPVFITSTVGCSSQQSVVFSPKGLMFQSDKGIWLLDRNLSTMYIGAPVEAYNSFKVVSALNIPGTNQVRFSLDNQITLMYDYYVDQWGTFSRLPTVSACLYKNMHTYLRPDGAIMEESLNHYLDDTRPVLMEVTTGWLNLAGLQGYQRFYDNLLLGEYKTPFKLDVKFAYDYNPSFQQSTIVGQDNYSPNYGNNTVWGGGESWGGKGAVFEARIFPEQQQCESFQVNIKEIYDSSLGVPAGAGLTLSGMNLTVGVSRSRRLSTAKRSFG